MSSLGEYLCSWAGSAGCAASGPTPQPMRARAKAMVRKKVRIECSMKCSGRVKPPFARISRICGYRGYPDFEARTQPNRQMIGNTMTAARQERKPYDCGRTY